MGKWVKMSIVRIDKKHRLVIPKVIRDRIEIKDRDIFFIEVWDNDTIILKRIDIEKILNKLSAEIEKKGIDLDKISREIEEEANRWARDKIEALFAGH